MKNQARIRFRGFSKVGRFSGVRLVNFLIKLGREGALLSLLVPLLNPSVGALNSEGKKNINYRTIIKTNLHKHRIKTNVENYITLIKKY